MLHNRASANTYVQAEQQIRGTGPLSNTTLDPKISSENLSKF